MILSGVFTAAPVCLSALSLNLLKSLQHYCGLHPEFNKTPICAEQTGADAAKNTLKNYVITFRTCHKGFGSMSSAAKSKSGESRTLNLLQMSSFLLLYLI